MGSLNEDDFRSGKCFSSGDVAADESDDAAEQVEEAFAPEVTQQTEQIREKQPKTAKSG